MLPFFPHLVQRVILEDNELNHVRTRQLGNPGMKTLNRVPKFYRVIQNNYSFSHLKLYLGINHKNIEGPSLDFFSAGFSLTNSNRSSALVVVPAFPEWFYRRDPRVRRKTFELLYYQSIRGCRFQTQLT